MRKSEDFSQMRLSKTSNVSRRTDVRLSAVQSFARFKDSDAILDHVKLVATTNLENYMEYLKKWGDSETTLRENLFYCFVRNDSFDIHHREALETLSEGNYLDRTSFCCSYED